MIGPWLFATMWRIDHACQRVRTRVLYAPFFGRVGRRSVIRRPTLITNPRFIEIGDRVTIRDGVRLEMIPLPGRPAPELRIGQDTTIEQNVHIVCHNRVVIGANVAITANCAIVDTTHPFEGLPAGVNLAGRIVHDDAFVEIGDGAFIGIGTVIMPNVRIGAGAVVGANSVVTGSLPDFCCAAGAPARVLRTYRPAGTGDD